MAGLLDFLQAASNAAASNVSGPIDLLSWALKKGGVPVGDAPMLGSEWMKRQGLMRDVPQSAASLAGETAGLLAPIGAAAKAPQIAAGILAGQDLAKQGAKAVGTTAADMTADYMARHGLSSSIVPPDAARRSGLAVQLPTDQVFADAVANTKGASIANDGLLMNLQRNQVPEQGMMPSVRGGVFYLPEGAQQAKYYSSGRNNYGGTERISGQTLLQRPMFVKGATGGKAPEAAYDQLLGKGAYQKMRADALHWSGGPKDIREEAVTKFLDKYAPELTDQAYYILQNSQKGNQLAYALQEAAVGSAVRKAGNDSVLGYSKARTGSPFISEVFDVREQLYPDKFGGYGLWPQFEK